MLRSETVSVRLSPEELELLEHIVEVAPQSGFANWFRERLYDEAWRLVAQGDDTLYELRPGLDDEVLIGRLAEPRWMDVKLVKSFEDLEAEVKRLSHEFLPEQLARLAGLPLAAEIDEIIDALKGAVEDEE